MLHHGRPEGGKGEQMLPLDFANIGHYTNIFVTILTFCQMSEYVLIQTLFFQALGLLHTHGAFNPLDSHRAKFQQ